MILLDTNVISEIMRPKPIVTVLDWLDKQDTRRLHVSTITIGEIEYGLQVLPNAKRRNTLRHKFERFISEGFKYRILEYDLVSSQLYGLIMRERRKSGKSMSISDGQIAAIAGGKGLAVATRNTKDFEGCKLKLINPFEV
jgi:predicted nucleic acid-binding protein